MKELLWAALVFSLFVQLSPAQATPVADIALGYSAIDVVKGPSLTVNGGSGSVGFNVNDWLGIVGDFGVYRASPSGGAVTAETYTFGPRLSYRHWKRLVPFAQVLFGGAHASATGGFTAPPNALALGAGGGADIRLDSGGRWALRPQVEYFAFGTIGSTTDTVRYSLGFVFHIRRT